MTDKTDREIMQRALEAMMDAMRVSGGISDKMFESVNAISERLAQPEQEPVAWLSTDSIGERYLWFSKPLDNDKAQPLYTAPQKREWQGLTDEERDAIIKSIPGETVIGALMRLLAREIEDKLKEKTHERVC